MVPKPATDGLKLPPETPFPEYVPPAGEPPLSANAGVYVQTPFSAPIETTGSVFTVIDCEAGAEVHPLVVTVRVTVPEVETEMDGVVSVVLQVFPVEEDDVKVTDPSWQKVVGPLAVIVGVAGIGFTVMVIGADIAVQPLPSVSVTVNVPEAETTIELVVSVVLQVLLVPDEVNATLCPEQNVVAPPAVITGVAGELFTVTTTGELIGLVHPDALVI